MKSKSEVSIHDYDINPSLETLITSHRWQPALIFARAKITKLKNTQRKTFKYNTYALFIGLHKRQTRSAGVAPIVFFSCVLCLLLFVLFLSCASCLVNSSLSPYDHRTDVHYRCAIRLKC